jgi:hypothetical protein
METNGKLKKSKSPSFPQMKPNWVYWVGGGGMHMFVSPLLLFFFLFQDNNKTWKRDKRRTNCDPTKSAERLIFTPRGCSFKRIVVCLIVYQTFPCFSIQKTEKVGVEKKEKKEVELNVVFM